MPPSENDPLIRTHTEPRNYNEELDNDRGNDARRVGPHDISKGTRYGILAGIWTATFLSTLNQTLVPTMLPSISSEFNKSNQASWLGTSYLLATCTFTPLYGRLCNVMGRKGANRTALLFAGLGVLLCGLSNSMEMLIFARFLSGIGGGGLMTTSSIIVSDMYSMRTRGLTQGVQSVFNGLGLGLGGPFGGLITDWLGWRWAFLIQMPMFVISFILTSYHLHYVTPGKSKGAKEVLKRIDYGGSVTLMISVGSVLVFLSAKYNEGLPWTDPSVIASIILAGVFTIAFFVVEFYFAPEPVLAPFLLKQKIPVLVGCSNFLVALCNFSIIYFFPMWFQTVLLTTASTAGLHLLPNSISMSLGSIFAGWMMHKTGKYKQINLIFGSFPFVGAILISRLQEDSGPIQSWLSIIPLGFGNAVVLQTMLIALLIHLPENAMAVGTGFGQLFRGIGQVGGVAVSSALFQSKLDTELRKRIHGTDAEEVIKRIRQSARLVASLPPDLQKKARESYDVSLKAVFVFAAACTLLAYLVRLPIPEKSLDQRPSNQGNETVPASPQASSVPETPVESGDEDDIQNNHPIQKKRSPRRRLSTYESTEGIMDLESDKVGGTARPRS